MRRFLAGLGLAFVVLGGFSVAAQVGNSGPSRSLERSSPVLSELQLLTDGTGNPGSSTRQRLRLASGQECPTNSRRFCSDQFPVCCQIHSQWVCRARLSD